MERPVATPQTDPDRWVSRHGDYLYRFAFAHLRSHHAAEEVVQEALLAALTARHRFRGGASERTWLTGILRRKVTDWLRAAVRQRERQQPLSARAADDLFTPWGKWKSPPKGWGAKAVARGMTREEFWETLAGCLDKLPVRQKEAFVLQHLEGQPATEARRSVGVSEGGFWVLLHRARLGLWRCLSVHWFGEDGP